MIRHLRYAGAIALAAAAFALSSCSSPVSSGDAQGTVPAGIQEQLQRYAQAFSFSSKLDPAESDRLLGLLCADSFRMSKASSGDDKTPPSVLDMNYSVVLSLLHMMHEAARDQEPSLADMVPKELSDAWVPFAKLKPQLQIAGILRHYPMGDAAYVTVVHDLHKGLPESMAPGGAHHYESHLTWVKGQDGWRLQNKIWVDVQGE